MLAEAEVLLSQGTTALEVVAVLGIREVSDYRWRQEYGGLSVSQAKRLKDHGTSSSSQRTGSAG